MEEPPWLEEKSVVKRVQMDSAPPAMSDTNGFNAQRRQSTRAESRD